MENTQKHPGKAGKCVIEDVGKLSFDRLRLPGIAKWHGSMGNKKLRHDLATRGECALERSGGSASESEQVHTIHPGPFPDKEGCQSCVPRLDS